jgi:DNA-binding CsgD family transcriptional regulator
MVRLTPREEEVLLMVAEQHSTQEIAEKLQLSRRTVENHRYRLMQKLGVKSAGGLVRYAMQTGMI